MSADLTVPPMPVVAYLRATKAGEPVWYEDCVCQDPVYPADPEGSDAECISMAMVRKSDADAAIAALQAELEALKSDIGPALTDIAALTARLAAAERDAARYRYIRANSYVELRCDSPRNPDWRPEHLDRLVDVAIADAATQEKPAAPSEGSQG